MNPDQVDRRVEKLLSTLSDIATLCQSAKTAIENKNYVMARVYLRIIAEEAGYVAAETKLMKTE